MLALLLSLSAGAIEPDLVLQRVQETRAFRTHRNEKGAPAISDDTYRKAAGGKVMSGLVEVDGHKAKKVWGVAVVDTPIHKFWSAINDDKGKISYTKLAYAEVFSGGLCGSPRRVFQYLPVPLITDRWWVATMKANPGLQSQSGGLMREQTWATDGDFTLPTASAQEWGEKGMHVESTRGAWLLVDLDGSHTLVEYYTWADPGGSVPAGLASSMAAGGVENTVQAMTKLAEAGPNCSLK